jgi:hypothetical protein
MAPALALDLEARARFVYGDGIGGGVTVNAQAGSHEHEWSFELQPAEPLRAESWCDVTYSPSTIELTDGFRFKPVISASRTYDLGEGVVTRFLPGSAPQLREVLHLSGTSDGGNTSDSLLVYFSEPVRIHDLATGAFLALATPALAGSLVMGESPFGEASPAPTADVREWVEYRVEGGLPERLELGLALSLAGVTRTVGDALDASLVRRPGNVVDRYLWYLMTPGTWPERSPGVPGWLNVEYDPWRPPPGY